MGAAGVVAAAQVRASLGVSVSASAKRMTASFPEQLQLAEGKPAALQVWPLVSGLRAAFGGGVSLQILGEVWVLPESPRYLVRSGNLEKARQSIRRLKIYKDPADVETLVRQLQAEVEQNRFLNSQNSVERGTAADSSSATSGAFQSVLRVRPFLRGSRL